MDGAKTFWEDHFLEPMTFKRGSQQELNRFLCTCAFSSAYVHFFSALFLVH